MAGAGQEGAEKVEKTVKLFMEDLLQIVISVQERKSSAQMERKKKANKKREKCLDRLKRKEKAEAQREALMAKLEAGWAAMEMENSQIEHTPIPEGWKGKRRRKPGSSEKKIMAERKAWRQETAGLDTDQVDQILDLVDSLTNDL